MGVCYIFGSGAYGGEGPAAFEEDDLIIAADGGYAALEAHGQQPHLLVGDFDSLGYVPPHPRILRHPVEKDDTDTALALEQGWERGYRVFHLYGCLGGRLDHTLGNLQLLTNLARRGGLGVLVGAEMTAATLCHGQLTFPAGCRGSLSVFAAGGVAEGVTIRGLQYPLEGGRLTGGETLGVSNAFLGEQAAVSVDRGCLLVVWASQSVLPVWSGLDSHQAIP